MSYVSNSVNQNLSISKMFSDFLSRECECVSKMLLKIIGDKHVFDRFKIFGHFLVMK